ncbi:MAG: sulfatase-like hydrolase/transferase [Verrucomicrobia bacterium]|nr:sulfatase-like hydrolase/transferase [Verrucomicrobiota bacterium]
MNLRWLSSFLVAAVIVVLAVPAGAATAAAPRPNIVLLMGDDHGWDETGYNGHPYLKTPVLDEMARGGLRLDRFYSGGSSCSPTRGTVMTGRHHNRYGIFNPGWSLRPEEISVAHLLRRAGYATAHFGKWHLGPVKAASPTNPGAMGFDTWLSHDNFFELNPWFSRDGGPPQQFRGESSELVVAEALRFIDRAQREKRPFFVVVWFGSPHEPYSGLPADLALYDGLPAGFGTREVKLTSNETGRNVTRLQREVLRERFAEITAMDRAIGQLRSHLGRTGLRADTLLWYCGDNGTPPEAVATVPFRAQKGAIYEGGIRVPGVIEWPARIARPRASDVNAVTSDILPTLCELAGQPLPARPLDGLSLVPLLEGRMVERPTPIAFWNARPRAGAKPYLDPELQKGTTPLAKLGPDGATRNFQNVIYPDVREEDYAGPRAIVDNRFKLVLDGEARRSGGPSRELFDLRADPAEQRNLIATHAAEAERLERQLRNWQTSVLNSLTGADYR